VKAEMQANQEMKRGEIRIWTAKKKFIPKYTLKMCRNVIQKLVYSI
jgi:hypothetical protein